ncbi:MULTISPECIES: hypothetical protein [unclassified Halomonas]|uniref:hypothetical protein n=1 Tax=unclassified Halomonas TaxID=2609666 RepID=UPI001C988C45|nr:MULTISPECIES: hypothetical protein [unclassified Halomonas]MBY5927404.1 hypothetical protein [Halomonas sp. DP4Y7-2]MBY6234445.1 hypothetical protein [Halomonas sp. DP4Y7-1]
MASSDVVFGIRNEVLVASLGVSDIVNRVEVDNAGNVTAKDRDLLNRYVETLSDTRVIPILSSSFMDDGGTSLSGVCSMSSRAAFDMASSGIGNVVEWVEFGVGTNDAYVSQVESNIATYQSEIQRLIEFTAACLQRMVKDFYRDHDIYGKEGLSERGERELYSLRARLLSNLMFLGYIVNSGDDEFGIFVSSYLKENGRVFAEVMPLSERADMGVMIGIAMNKASDLYMDRLSEARSNILFRECGLLCTM